MGPHSRPVTSRVMVSDPPQRKRRLAAILHPGKQEQCASGRGEENADQTQRGQIYNERRIGENWRHDLRLMEDEDFRGAMLANCLRYFIKF